LSDGPGRGAPGCSKADEFQENLHMAVQKSRKTPSKRGMRRAHDALPKPTLSIEPTTGEVHRRHNISPDGYYKGRQVVQSAEEP
jgi:large subunit ribosomal protein L32